MSDFFNAIQPALLSAAEVIISAVIAVAGAQLAKFIRAKVGATNYEKLYNFAVDAFNITDEYFRITPTVQKTVDTTFNKFKAELLKKAPGLTDDEINSFRLAVAGAINKGREALDPAKVAEAEKPVTETDPAAISAANAQKAIEEPAASVPVFAEGQAVPVPQAATPASEGVNASDTTGAD